MEEPNPSPNCVTKEEKTNVRKVCLFDTRPQCANQGEYRNTEKKEKEGRIPLAEDVPIVRCPSPSLLPLLPQGPEAALRALMWGGRWLTK